MQVAHISLALALLSACRMGFEYGAQGAADDAGAIADASNARDAGFSPDTGPVDAGPCVVTAHVDFCNLIAPDGPLTMTTPGLYVYNTDTGILTHPEPMTTSMPASQFVAPSVIISVADVVLGDMSTLRVEGDASLIIASWTTMNVDGIIDVSTSSGTPGAGNSLSVCAAPGAGTSSAEGAAGGGGGGFQGMGGSGAEGDSGVIVGGPGGGALPVPTSVVGGCPGGAGGVGDAPGGAPGGGGGAVQLTALTSISLTGTIDASGEGGRGGMTSDGGGGGAGSGGFIGIDAPNIFIGSSAILAANGGGGGGGASDENQDDGDPGSDGSAGDSRASGGVGGAGGGGAGGQGSGGGALAGESGFTGASEGGGGGGGGAGFIVLYVGSPATIQPGAIISPQQQLVP